jgi:hypothetical protein
MGASSPRQRSRERATPTAPRAAGAAFGCRGCGCDLPRTAAHRGQRPIPRGPVVLVANHVGYLDPLVLASIVPSCRAKPSSRAGRWSGLRRRAWRAVRPRGDAASGARCCAPQGERCGVAVGAELPEGTTTRGGRCCRARHLRPGAHADVPVVPAACSTTSARVDRRRVAAAAPARTLASASTVRASAAWRRAATAARDLAREAHDVVEHLLGEG